ncbi:MAG: glutamate--tRNA ligase [Burkholderiales bacterium]|nr:glutamate--tRNA ligase [Burkholderiales bacterium]
MIRTRFAPSPTGFLHIGGARTALFSWAYAQRNQGKFILRIEDTDIERSTTESVQSILDAMVWLNLPPDEGPYYQTSRMNRYQEIIQRMLTEGSAYYCYCSKQELEQMREQQKLQGIKPKYDRRCLHHGQKNTNTKPVVRFKNPETGSVIWHDLVKGKIEFSNLELDDLIIARSDGVPTYNFCVVVDDLDMNITHVIRGDDHVNNTPRQINILQALNAPIPLYGHVPMILREDGEKMSKRRDAVSVMQYKAMGILPEALLNYLAKLCWGYGDEEIFTMEQFVNWFDLNNVSGSPARFDIKKLFWVNAQHLKLTNNNRLKDLVLEIWQQDNAKYNQVLSHVEQYGSDKLEQLIELIKPRVDNLNSLANNCIYFFTPFPIADIDCANILTNDAQQILTKFVDQINQINVWTLENIKLSIKEFCQTNQIKMPQLGMPLRLQLFGTKETPAFDALMYLLGKDETLNRLGK